MENFPVDKMLPVPPENTLWKTKNLSTFSCGRQALDFQGLRPVFHIKFPYCCYYYILTSLFIKTGEFLKRRRTLMRFTCEKSTLVTAISVASRTVAQKSTLPAIEGIYFRAGLNLQLTGFNLETAITVTAEADIQETGACIMPARLLFDIVRRMPEGEIRISVDDNYKVSIRAEHSSFNISAGNAEDYPELPDVESRNSVSIPQQKLREMISGTIFAVAENQSRPIHTGCLFEVEDTAISVVAVDGYRLARRTWHPEAPLGKTMHFVVPAAALKEVEKILGDEGEARFSLGPKHILFEIGSATLVCRLLEGDFLDWRRVVPTDCPVKLTANVSDLAVTIDRVGLIVTEKLKSPVRCVFGDNVASFRTATTIGVAEDQCAIAGNGQELEIGFNCRYLADALRAVPSEEVCLELKNGLSPIVFTPVREEDDFAYMVLPVRLRSN